MDFSKLKILVIGVGGLGCPASLALAEAGVGKLSLMDPDKVEVSNLHRQILYASADIGKPKVEAAAAFFRKNYPQVEVEALQESMDSETMAKRLPHYDLVVDGLDRLEKKYFLNDKCVQFGKPYVHAGVVKFEGQVLAVKPGETACLRCLLPKIPPPFAMPTCREAGVLGSFSQAMGYLQAEECLRLAQGKGPYRLWKMDIQKREVRSLLPERNPECEACGKGRFAEKLTEPFCAS